MRYIFSAATLFLLFACTETDLPTPNIPDCIQDIIDKDESPDELQSVQRQSSLGRTYFWLNTGVIPVDGIEYIVDSDCDTICSIGGLLPNNSCPTSLRTNWDTLWIRP